MINLDNRITLRKKIEEARHWLGFLIFILFLGGCENSIRTISIDGETMGTTYNIQIVLMKEMEIDESRIKHSIDSLLIKINNQLSHYIPQSEISLFNDNSSVQPFKVSAEFYSVVLQSKKLTRLTSGAFDITIAPLVNYWGFGPVASPLESGQLPDTLKILDLLEAVSSQNLFVRDEHLIKSNPNMRLDLSAIAKGYGVDAIFMQLGTMGFTNYMVEIGGEVRCSGNSVSGKPWRIGIDRPDLNLLPGKKLQGIVQLYDRALATSGDYRNYLIVNGEFYPHAIDPRTGFPVKTKVASATVIAPTCAEADALATALMVLGEESGITLINDLDEIDAALILRDGDGIYRTVLTNGFKWAE
jgi:thiamine biosynthesis lipoprotein